VRTSRSGWASFSVVAALIAMLFLGVESWYGDAWLVPWHDEVVIARLAQNWAMGKGFRNDLLEGVLTGAERRTFWQMPLYPMALALWGKVFGFDLNALRWLSRLLGMCGLLLTFALARRLGASPIWCALAMLWVASDLNFQFFANFARPEMLCGTLLLLAAFLSVPRPSSLAPFPSWWLIGIIVALSVLTHPIALPMALVLTVIAYRRSGWQGAIAVIVPLLLAMAGWLLYAATDWAIFLAQMRAHWLHKERTLMDWLVHGLGVTFWGFYGYLGVPLNAVPALAIVVTATVATLRRHSPIPKSFLTFAIALYAVTALGGEASYPALCTPFVYLLAALLFQGLGERKAAWGRVLVAIALAWWAYQASVVARHLIAVPKIRRELATFYADLSRSLPPNARLLVGSFSPDPTFHLLRFRPDVRVYELMPLPMVDKKAFAKLRPQLTHALLLRETRWRGGIRLQRWYFSFGGLAESERGITLVLWQSSQP
jgi:hypothetical protein